MAADCITVCDGLRDGDNLCGICREVNADKDCLIKLTSLFRWYEGVLGVEALSMLGYCADNTLLAKLVAGDPMGASCALFHESMLVGLLTILSHAVTSASLDEDMGPKWHLLAKVAEERPFVTHVLQNVWSHFDM
eukprot:CAMPEP_0114291072 /NCGR_PEP_ID=MMETSP0059-20121206/8286_1 /TAXON_ID=36894 /ORGANISM="Pyramimonas parkeae, Strain CCMP726" /LENGTH=134 /DNA_ID=CAMNT_0001412535 /DNA_START=332 /DNA_END=737 /DNA_ORIENTATION=-